MQKLVISDLKCVDLKDVPNESVYIACGWYDWFCTERSLKNRSKKFISLAKRLDDNWDKVKFFLKNNCPMIGSTYDSIALQDSDGENVYWIERASSEWIVYDVKKNITLFEGSTKVKEVAEFINTLTPPK